jgi:hypothetical protein
VGALPLLAVDELVGHEIHRAGIVRPARPEVLAAGSAIFRRLGRFDLSCNCSSW